MFFLFFSSFHTERREGDRGEKKKEVEGQASRVREDRGGIEAEMKRVEISSVPFATWYVSW